MIKDIRDLYYLKSLLEFEKAQMEESNVSNDFFEYNSVTRWLEELEERIKNMTSPYEDKEFYSYLEQEARKAIENTNKDVKK